MGTRILAVEGRKGPVLEREVLGVAVVDGERFTVLVTARADAALNSCVENCCDPESVTNSRAAGDFDVHAAFVLWICLVAAEREKARRATTVAEIMTVVKKREMVSICYPTIFIHRDAILRRNGNVQDAGNLCRGQISDVAGPAQALRPSRAGPGLGQAEPSPTQGFGGLRARA